MRENDQGIYARMAWRLPGGPEVEGRHRRPSSKAQRQTRCAKPGGGQRLPGKERTAPAGRQGEDVQEPRSHPSEKRGGGTRLPYCPLSRSLNAASSCGQEKGPGFPKHSEQVLSQCLPWNSYSMQYLPHRHQTAPPLEKCPASGQFRVFFFTQQLPSADNTSGQMDSESR